MDLEKIKLDGIETVDDWQSENLTPEQEAFLAIATMIDFGSDGEEHKTLLEKLLVFEKQYMETHEQLTCCICGKPLYNELFQEAYFGHNAMPVADGRCCDDCQALFVAPAREAG